VRIERNQVVGALILAAAVLLFMLLRWKFAR